MFNDNITILLVSFLHHRVGKLFEPLVLQLAQRVEAKLEQTNRQTEHGKKTEKNVHRFGTVFMITVIIIILFAQSITVTMNNTANKMPCYRRENRAMSL